jgi:hypothetical protein
MLVRILSLPLLACITLGENAAAYDHAVAREARVAELPPQARRTLELVKRGGPFPYRRDGAPFDNRNWDALEDCLTDLSWIEARGFRNSSRPMHRV